MLSGKHVIQTTQRHPTTRSTTCITLNNAAGSTNGESVERINERMKRERDKYIHIHMYNINTMVDERGIKDGNVRSWDKSTNLLARL